MKHKDQNAGLFPKWWSYSARHIIYKGLHLQLQDRSLLSINPHQSIRVDIFAIMRLPNLAVSTLLFTGLVYGYAGPGACSGDCTVHDPALIRRESDGTYFRFSTGSMISYASAPAIEGPWTTLGSALPGGSSINLAGNTDLWVGDLQINRIRIFSSYNTDYARAPDVQLVDGTYYLYYSVSTFGSQDSAIGVASSDTMDIGTWTDHGSTGIQSDASKSYNAIDGNLLNDNGTLFLNFGSFWNDIYQASMESPTSAASSLSNIAYQPSGEHAVEGAYMYKYGDWYYLFFSEGQCCNYITSMPAAGEEYKIKVCRSSSATGGFVSSQCQQTIMHRP
jgi:arabinan endo-1,5-alpha-L-arabinosidase